MEANTNSPATVAVPSEARRPDTFAALFLTALTNLYLDIHVNLSGAVFFACIAVGIFWPDYSQQSNQLLVAAGTYLFASAKAKS